jgi:hypothetical protein
MNIPEVRLLIELEWSEHGDYYKHKHKDVFPYTDNELTIADHIEKMAEEKRLINPLGRGRVECYGYEYSIYEDTDYIASAKVQTVLWFNNKAFKMEEVDL